MYIARRRSDRETTHFPVGSYVIARPATMSNPIAGIVVATSEPYTLTVSAPGTEIAVDVEDCLWPPNSPTRIAPCSGSNENTNLLRQCSP